MSADTTEDTQADKLILATEFIDALMSGGGFPANNTIGTILLAQLLDSVLEAAGQLLSPTIFMGPLNQCFCQCYVRDMNESARVICQMLEKSPLKSGVRLLRFDKSEGVLRCVWPAAGDVVNKDEILNKMRAVSGWTDSAIVRMEQWSQLLEKLKQAQKPGDAPKQ